MRKEVKILQKKKIKIALIVAIAIALVALLSFLIFFFSLNKEIDLSLIKAGASSITRIYYFDYENREKRTGKAVELTDEAIFLQKSEWCSIYDMPKHLSNAFIAIEDKRFFEHGGVDFLRTGKATLNYIFGKNKSRYGGSTITQQLIKNLTGDNESTPKRKIEEILRALSLEAKLSKNEILEAYLNVVYLSNNSYGVRTGAKTYFDKELEDLTLAECASLAAIVKSPTRYNPYSNLNNNLQRQRVVLKEMLNQGMISADEYYEALEERLDINENISTEVNSGIYSWYTEALINDVSTDLAKKKGISFDAAREKLLRGGYNIYSTVDPKLQETLEDVYSGYAKYILPENGKYPESACVIIDPKTSDVLAIVGGKGKKSANMLFNRATQAKRPPGSVIKPLSAYAPAIEKGIINYSTIIEDLPLKIENNAAWPKNSPDKYRGNVPIYFALERSINTVAAKVVERLGIKNSINFLNSLLVSVDKNDNNLSSLALGQLSNGETLLNITNAYSIFANGGYISRPKTYLYVTDNYGNVVLENETNINRVISPQTSQIMTKMLQNVVAEGTAKGVRISNENIDIAGKTGTSSNNEDRWFIGFTPDYVCGVWTGFDTPKAINTSVNPSCSLFSAIFEKIYSNKDEISKFSLLDSISEEEICTKSGKKATEQCKKEEKTTIGYYFNGEELEYCDIHTMKFYNEPKKIKKRGLWHIFS